MKDAHYKVIDFIKSLYPGLDPVPLHAPVFGGNEKKYLLDCIDTTFVSYVGKYVSMFEEMTAQFTGAKYAVAMVNGTTALQLALQLVGVDRGDEVLTQALTFVATANAISHAGGKPVFLDVDKDTLGMSPDKLESWLSQNVLLNKNTNRAINRMTGNVISAILPMHTFGNPCRIDAILEIANKYSIPVVEDSAESLGSFYKGKHTGTFGSAGVFSYNGNKTITTGGGGMIVTDDEQLAVRAKHLTTTAKKPHRWEFDHDEIAYNYRLTNVNAAIGVAQMEKIEDYLLNKKLTAQKYAKYFGDIGIEHVRHLPGAKSNNWLTALILNDKIERENFLNISNDNGVVTRPIWQLMSQSNMYMNCQCDDLENSRWLGDRVVNVPSGVNLQK